MPAQEIVYRQKTFDLHDTEGQLNALHEDGFALIPNVLSAEEVDAAKQKIDELKPFGYDSQGVMDHYKCVFNRDPFWLPFLDRPGVIELAEASMGEECHIIGQTAWRSHPGHNGWGNHVDQLFVPMPEEFFAHPDFRLPIFLCTAHYYLNDITEDLCPTYVIPGSHKSGRGPNPGEETWHGRGLEPVLCKAGDVLFFRSEIWHTGSVNKTQDQTRYLLQVHYSHRMIAQKFSPYLYWQFSPYILGVCNPRQRRLLGEHRRSNYD